MTHESEHGADPRSSVVQQVGSFFAVLDTSLDSLCHKQEGFTANLPRWALAGRQIRIGHVARAKDPYYIIRAAPRSDGASDEIKYLDLMDDAQLQAFAVPFQIGSSFYASSRGPLWLTDATVTLTGESLSPAVSRVPDVFAFVGVDQLAEVFSEEQAKEHALDLWSQAAFGPLGDGSFIEGLRSVFDRFSNLVKRKSFVERRIHRYIRDHARFLLPDHQRCFFEHDLILGDETRPADLILERDAGLPALLIELETPAARIFTKRGEPTKETNHAKAQIAEWVRFIETDSRNTAGDMAFLRG